MAAGSFFNEKRSIGQAKWIQEIFHHTILCKIHKYSVSKVGFCVCYFEEHKRAEKSPKVVKAIVQDD